MRTNLGARIGTAVLTAGCILAAHAAAPAPASAAPRPGSGLLHRAAGAATTSYLLYPGGMYELGSIPVTYAKKSTPTVDTTDTYDPGTKGGYCPPALVTRLWQHVDAGGVLTTPIPPAMTGTKFLWMGQYKKDFAVSDRMGYPNNSDLQILYVDTGAHASDYTLTFTMNLSCHTSDALYVLGGGSGDTTPDPLGNDRTAIETILELGESGPARLLATITGTHTANLVLDTTGGPVRSVGSGTAEPATVTAQLTVDQDHRGVYFVFRSDGSISSESSGLSDTWLYGNGATLDDIGVSGSPLIFDEQSSAGIDEPAFSGTIILGTLSNPILSARVPSETSTTCMSVALGSSASTGDYCLPGKSLAADHMFQARDSLTMTTPPDVDAALTTLAIPLTPGTGRLFTTWTQYMDLPRGSGLTRTVRYQVFRDGAWSSWYDASPARAREIEGGAAWFERREELPFAALADSVRLRYGLECVPSLSMDGETCPSVSLGLLFDNLGLVEVSGIPPVPVFSIYTGDVLQSTFVDGTMTGVNCTGIPCWPGIRGSDLAGHPNPAVAASAIDDNVNTSVGDSMVVRLQSALRLRGMGINWRHGFDKAVAFGKTIAHTNAAYQPAWGPPLVIYRIFDPATKSWSPFDSTELDADFVSVGAIDTVVVGDAFRFDWPPRDKIGLSLPGGFAVNGVSAYSSLAYLPRGARLQYYFKLVDIAGTVVYQFRSDLAGHETVALPTLPGGTIAPDILEFDVLPGVYPAGTAGTLLAGRTTTPLLHIDAGFGAWSSALDPMTQALRGLGVRADRYRVQPGIDLGNNVGGRPMGFSQFARTGNFFPTMDEYGIRDSLASWYRIVLVSSHDATFTRFSDSDARLLREWHLASTGPTDGGDRCIFASGDHFFGGILDPALPALSEGTHQIQFVNDVFGVAAVTSAWAGTGIDLLPTMDDRFVGGGPGLGAPLGATYPADGGCGSGPRRFDALVPVGSPSTAPAVYYPGAAQVAAVARATETDGVPDKDRGKAIGYGYSIQFVRQAGIPTSSPSFAHSGVVERMSVLYKLLTGCRGARTSAQSDTGVCWPCPADANMSGNWAILPGFETGTYGPLYPIQDFTTITALEEEAAVPAAPQWLAQNRPNPFNPSTEIPFALSAPGPVRLAIFDVRGRLVVELLNRHLPAGLHASRWDGRTRDGRRAGSGVYFYRIEFPDRTVACRKLTLLQ